MIGPRTWKAINLALVGGGRGLPGGFSLAKLLAKERWVRNKGDLPYLHDAYYRGLIGRTLVFSRALTAEEVAGLTRR